jgi:hypothetical protein
MHTQERSTPTQEVNPKKLKRESVITMNKWVLLLVIRQFLLQADILHAC